MTQNFNSSQLPQLLKKIFLTILIALMAWIFYQLGDHYLEHSQTTKIPASNTPFEIYSNQTQDDLTHLYQHAIENARESITLVIYALTDPQIIQALQTKSESGVPVYIVYDAQASSDISHRIPRATIVKRAGKGLMHQKILIVDNKEIWLGSANLTTSSLNLHNNLVMSIENPSLAEALTKRAKSMDEVGENSLLLHRETSAGNQNLELWVLPDDPQSAQRIIDLFRSAEKTIKVAMFTWTRTDFAEELIAAAKRGVQVEVVIDRYSGKGASSKIVRLLEQNNVTIRLSSANKLMHHKFAYIDDIILVNGSTNWTYSAFDENDDYFIVMYPLTNEQQMKMNRIWSLILKDSESANLSSTNTIK